MSQQIILVGHFEVLLVTAYFFAGRTAEVKNKSDLLLAQIYLHCAATNLPFIIAADFNNPVRDFPAYAAFRATRCQEAFHLAQCKFGQTLPPTCRGSTRNDSFIIHETLVPFVKDIWVGAPEVFPDHRPLFLQLQLPSKQVVCRSWFIPQTWGEIPLDPGTLEQCYTNNQARFTSRTDLNTEEKINRAFHRWSKGVENAVQKCVQIQHEQDPLHTPKPCLPQKFFGRGAPTKLVTHISPRTIKNDPTQAYDPPVEATSTKAKHKARQTRRLVSLLRQIRHSQKSHNPSTFHAQIRQEWEAIRRAQGYGRAWATWLLSFECIPWVPCTLPTL